MNSPNKRPTVWVVKEQMKTGPHGVSPMDYSSAYEYGDLRFITEFDPPLHQGTVREEWDKQVLKFVKEYDPSTDFVVLTGSPLAIFLVGTILGAINSQHRPRLLVWRREQSRYVVFS